MNTTATDQLVTTIQTMDRPALTKALLTLQSRFPMDFSEDYLAQCSEEKLRHVLFAATLQAESKADTA